MLNAEGEGIGTWCEGIADCIWREGVIGEVQDSEGESIWTLEVDFGDNGEDVARDDRLTIGESCSCVGTERSESRIRVNGGTELEPMFERFLEHPLEREVRELSSTASSWETSSSDIGMSSNKENFFRSLLIGTRVIGTAMVWVIRVKASPFIECYSLAKVEDGRGRGRER